MSIPEPYRLVSKVGPSGTYIHRLFLFNAELDFEVSNTAEPPSRMRQRMLDGNRVEQVVHSQIPQALQSVALH